MPPVNDDFEEGFKVLEKAMRSEPAPGKNGEDFEENFDTKENSTAPVAPEEKSAAPLTGNWEIDLEGPEPKAVIEKPERNMAELSDIPSAVELSRDPAKWTSPKVQGLRRELVDEEIKKAAAKKAATTQPDFEEDLSGPAPTGKEALSMKGEIATELRRRAGMELDMRRKAYVNSMAMLEDEARYEKFPGGAKAMDRLVMGASLRSPIYPADAEFVHEEEAVTTDEKLPADVRLRAAVAASPIFEDDPERRTIPGSAGQEVEARKRVFMDHVTRSGRGREFAERLYSFELNRVSYEHERYISAREKMSARSQALLEQENAVLRKTGKSLNELSPEDFTGLRAHVERQVRKEVFEEFVVKEAEALMKVRSEKNPYHGLFESFSRSLERFSSRWGRLNDKLAEMGLRPMRGIELERRAALEALTKRFTTETGPLARLNEYGQAMSQIIEKNQTREWQARLRRGGLVLAATLGLAINADAPARHAQGASFPPLPKKPTVEATTKAPVPEAPAPTIQKEAPAPVKTEQVVVKTPPAKAEIKKEAAKVEPPIVKAPPAPAAAEKKNAPPVAADTEPAGPPLSEVRHDLPPRELTDLEKEMAAEKEPAPEVKVSKEDVEAALKEKFAPQLEAMNAAGHEYLALALENLAKMNPGRSLTELAGNSDMMEVHIKLALEAGNLSDWEVETMKKLGFQPKEYVDEGYLEVIRKMKVRKLLAHIETGNGNFLLDNQPAYWEIGDKHKAFAAEIKALADKAGTTDISIADLIRRGR
ncbi:MAG TPA: hypothetical protein VMC43_02145 [Candidatus Paceibacterota bacterium]|nr:hypothetical protein [Candidatus Paceibacterota bacterium]